MKLFLNFYYYSFDSSKLVVNSSKSKLIVVKE